MTTKLKGSRLLLVALTVVLGLVATTATVRADLGSAKVRDAFSGKLVITQNPVVAPDGTDRQVIAALKRMSVKRVPSYNDNAGSQAWQFSFIAFLTQKPGVRNLSVEFYTADHRSAYVANKRLTGINPSLTLLQADINITEDEGVAVDQTYVVKVTATKRGKEIVLAQAKLTLSRAGTTLTML